MSNEFEITGLDRFTDRAYRRLAREYPQKAEKMLKKEVGGVKGEAISRTPVGPTGNLKKRWKHKFKIKNGHQFGVVMNSAPHAHLIENGHVTKNGGWWEGKHMLENTMTHRRGIIDANIDRFVQEMLNI